MNCAHWYLKYHGIRDMTWVNTVTLTIPTPWQRQTIIDIILIIILIFIRITILRIILIPFVSFILLSSSEFIWGSLPFPTLFSPDQITKVQRVHPVSPNFGEKIEKSSRSIPEVFTDLAFRSSKPLADHPMGPVGHDATGSASCCECCMAAERGAERGTLKQGWWF